MYGNSIQNGTNKDWIEYKLTVSSAPLRQVLCLRYGLPLGYKCSFVDLTDEINSIKTREDKVRLFATAMETEGSFTFQRGRIPKPILSFSSLSKKLAFQVFSLAKDLGYEPSPVNLHKVTSSLNLMYFFKINSIDGTLKCIHDVLPFLSHNGKIHDIRRTIMNPDILHAIKFRDPNKANKLITKARQKTMKSKHTLNRDLADFLQLENPTTFKYKRSNVNGWLCGKAIPAYAVIGMCKQAKEDYHEYLPSYIDVVVHLQDNEA